MSIFTADYITRNYKEFFKYVSVDVNETKLVDIINKAWSNKSELRKFFPFDSEGRVLIATYSDPVASALKSFEKTIKVLTGVLSRKVDLGIASKYLPRMIINNCIETGKYAGRKVSRLLSSGVLSAYEREQIIEQDLCTELPRLPLHGKSAIDLIVQNFYSELAQAKKNTSYLYFTINPIDILNASVDKVLSCNKLGGCAESAPMSAATSSRMAMARVVTEDGTLLGRCYIGISPDMMGYIFQPCYGMMGSAHTEDVRKWLRMYIDGKVPPIKSHDTWKESKDVHYSVPTEIFAESSTANFYTDPVDTVMYRGEIDLINCGLYVGTSYCVLCGKETKGLFCDDCAASKFCRCTNCGTLIYKGILTPEQSIDGFTLCHRCLRLHAECAVCGRHFVKSTVSSPNVCYKCENPKASCFVCGRQIYPENSNTIELVSGSVYAHSGCLHKKHDSACIVCGKSRALTVHGSICLGCAPKFLRIRILETYIRKLKNFNEAIKSVAHTVCTCLGKESSKAEDSTKAA